MASYRDLPSDLEKYSLTPYLSSKDIASLSLVDRKRRELYDLKYWEKRLLSEEGISLPDYEDDLGPYIRYSRAKRYLKARKSFYKKKISQHPSSIGEMPTLFKRMVKYGSPSQIEEDSKYAYPYVNPYFFIVQDGSIPMIKRFLPEKLDKVAKYAFSEGRTDVIDYLGYSKHDIMDILLRRDNYGMLENNVEKVVKYASTLEGKVEVIGWKDKNGDYLLSRDNEFIIKILEELGLTDLLPSNNFTIHTGNVPPPEDYPLPMKYI